ncbi:MAG: hypothetical protein WCR52_02050 [Bacteroidota bacterium]
MKKCFLYLFVIALFACNSNPKTDEKTVSAAPVTTASDTAAAKGSKSTDHEDDIVPEAKEALEPPTNLTPAPGAIRISELVANLAKYKGKVVKVTGKVVKVNNHIMGKNWVHLQDGSGKKLDLTVTTADDVQLGSIITMEGTIAVDKDFTAGYRYDYIMEAATIAK